MSVPLTTQLKRLIEARKPYILARDIKQAISAAYRKSKGIDGKVASLAPNNKIRGFALLSYIIEPFFLRPGQSIPNTHTNYWGSQQIARTLADLGYWVDVIDYRNQSFIPVRDYSLCIDVRRNLERLASRLGENCIKVMHLDTAHILFHNAAEANRLLELQQRRGITLPPRRFEMPNLGIEHADCAITNGGKFTISTFGYANKPIYRVPCPIELPFLGTDNKDFEKVNKNFLWFASGGMVHKGLDLVLEAFAEMPQYHLTVCGPIHNEPDFEKAFYRELYETPNISTIGWIDLNSPKFKELTDKCIGVVSASCSESAGIATIICMGTGLIPIYTNEACAAAGDNVGFVLEDCKIDTIKKAIKGVANMPADTLRQMSRDASDYVKVNHTREKFTQEYKRVLEEAISIYGK